MKKRIILMVSVMLLILTGTTAIGKTAIPDIPEGDLSARVIEFNRERFYPVYSAPDDDSMRGANGRARVSTRDWIQVFGSDGSFILIQYGTMENRLRIGYILKSALPKDARVSMLHFDNSVAILNTDSTVTDDPLVSEKELTRFSAGEQVIHLAYMGKWSYVEGTKNGKRLRGFVPTSALTICKTITDIKEATKALMGSWTLAAGERIAADNLYFSDDGTLTSKTGSTQWYGSWSLRRISNEIGRYLNAPEFELSISHDGQTEQHGLRICVKPDDGKSILILSDEDGKTNLTKYE